MTQSTNLHQSDTMVSITAAIKQAAEQSPNTLTKAQAFKTLYEKYAPHDDTDFDLKSGSYYLSSDAHQYLKLLPFNLTSENVPKFLFGDDSTLEFSSEYGCQCDRANRDEMWHFLNYRMARINKDGVLSA